MFQGFVHPGPSNRLFAAQNRGLRRCGIAVRPAH
jgi:hypothetical protein